MHSQINSYIYTVYENDIKQKMKEKIMCERMNQEIIDSSLYNIHQTKARKLD